MTLCTIKPICTQITSHIAKSFQFIEWIFSIYILFIFIVMYWNICTYNKPNYFPHLYNQEFY